MKVFDGSRLSIHRDTANMVTCTSVDSGGDFIRANIAGTHSSSGQHELLRFPRRQVSENDAVKLYSLLSHQGDQNLISTPIFDLEMPTGKF